jgi:ribosome-dependent ATPase
MEAGRVLATGPPAQIKARHGVATLEQAYVALMPEARQGRPEEAAVPTHWEEAEPPVIVAEGLTCRFGDFTAVESVSFTISPGEIFGFLGSNGCGKTTTMKMLTGLLPATEGRAWLLGRPVEADAMAARRRVGYMSQAFSLYGELTVLQNLVLHGRLFQLNPDQIRVRLEALVGPFGLEGCLHQLPDQLPLGLRQRLSLAVALVHSPDLLILDEPTSGVDPVARDAFWDLLIRLSRRDRVTIFISTHFMNEAMRCDRISLMHAGSVLAQGTPAQLQTERGASSLEEAFIECIKEATGASVAAEAQVPFPARARDAAPPSRFSLSRLLAFSRREMQEVLRDPVRLGFAFIGSALLFVVFGFGINTDVDQVRFAVLDLDRTPQSRAYAAGYAGAGTLFKQQADLAGPGELEARMRDGAVTAALEIPPGFGRDLERGAGPQVSVWVDGANPWRAETIQTFLEGVHQHTMHQREPAAAVTLEPRFKYNPGLESTQSMVPEVMALLLVLIPSILMAVSVVREKELGSITNFQVTPATRFEFLLGKQLPYIGIGMLNFGMLALLAATVFKVPLKGNPLALAVGALLYIAATTGFGLLVSAVTSSQVAAVIATAIVSLLEGIQFSGMIQPVSTLQGAGRLMGELWPTTYFMRTSIGAYNKAMGFRGLSRDLALLGAFAVAFSLLSALALRKQER